MDYWSAQCGEKHGIVILPIPTNCVDVAPDIYIFNIDNYVDEAQVDAALATGARVAVFFRLTHGMDNSIPGELKAVEDLTLKIKTAIAISPKEII